MKPLFLLVLVCFVQPVAIDRVMDPIQLPLQDRYRGDHLDLDEWSYPTMGRVYPTEERALHFVLLNNNPSPLKILNITTRGENLEVVRSIDYWFNASAFILPPWEEHWFTITVRFYAAGYYEFQAAEFPAAHFRVANARLLLNMTTTNSVTIVWQYVVPFDVLWVLPCGGVEYPQRVDSLDPDLSQILYRRDFQLAMVLFTVCTPALWWALKPSKKKEREP